MIGDAIKKLIDGNHLTETEMIDTMNQIMEGETTDAQIACFLTALRLKGRNNRRNNGCCAGDARKSNPNTNNTTITRRHL